MLVPQPRGLVRETQRAARFRDGRGEGVGSQVRLIQTTDSHADRESCSGSLGGTGGQGVKGVHGSGDGGRVEQ